MGTEGEHGEIQPAAEEQGPGGAPAAGLPAQGDAPGGISVMNAVRGAAGSVAAAAAAGAGAAASTAQAGRRKQSLLVRAVEAPDW